MNTQPKNQLAAPEYSGADVEIVDNKRVFDGFRGGQVNPASQTF